MDNNEYCVKLNEEFGPVPTYKQYLILGTVISFCVLWLFVAIGILFPPIPNMIKFAIIVIPILILAGLATIWSVLYFDTVHYVLNDTEITWQRGIWFHATGIVPYNRITDVTISQGPIMKLFGISSVGIRTAGGGAPKGGAEINIEGQLHATELRAIIMDHVREAKNSGGATIGVAETYRTPASNGTSQNAEILEELRKIREILEKKE